MDVIKSFSRNIGMKRIVVLSTVLVLVASAQVDGADLKTLTLDELNLINAECQRHMRYSDETGPLVLREVQWDSDLPCLEIKKEFDYRLEDRQRRASIDAAESAEAKKQVLKSIGDKLK